MKTGRSNMKRIGVLTIGASIALVGHFGCMAQRSSKDATVSVEKESHDKSEVGLTGSGAEGEEGKAAPGQGLGPRGPEVLLGKLERGAALPDGGVAIEEKQALLVAIDTPYQIFDNQGTYVHVAAWHTDGAPARGAKVHVGSFQVGATDEHGSLVFLYPPKGVKDAKVLGANVVTVVDAKNSASQGSVSFSPNLRTASFASDHLFVYTDRGVYKPGDTVSVRAIGWHLKEDYKPLEEADVEFILKDAAGKVVGGARRTTDEFGISSMQIPLPGTATEGLYTLEVAYKQERQRARLQVREFKPPTVRIAHDLGRFITRDQKKLSASISLSPSAGGDFKKGDLTLSATIDSEPIFTMKKSVSGSGPHVFDVSEADFARLKARAYEGGWVKVAIGVRDKLGREDELVREMRYVVNPYVAVIELDKDQYSTGDPVEIIAKVRDLDGVPLRSKEISVQVGSERFTAKTDASGTAQFSTEMPGSTTPVKLFIKGVKTPIATQSLVWVAPRAMVSHIATPIIKEREKARVKVRFPAGIIPAEKVVHMDIVDTSGAIVNAVLLPITETSEGYIAAGEFDSPTWGSMLLTFFALGKRAGATVVPDRPHHALGLLTEGQNLVVHPNRELEILLDGIPDEVSPGEEVAIRAKVKDAQGTLTSASLGAAVVDGRVISLKDPLEITPMDHFYEPTLRTMSTTGSKILSWPVVSRNWGPRIHDVALPPFPYLEGGAVTHLRARRGSGPMGAGLEEESAEEGAPAPEPEPEPDGVMAQGYGSGKGMAKPKSKKVMISADKIVMGGVAGMDAGEDIDALTMDGAPTDQDNESRRSTRSRPGSLAPVTITIRTSFEETSLWRPHMRAEGTLEFTATMPDSVSEQEVIVVASDARGGVGVTRSMIKVTQPLHAQADFPKFLRAGERVMVPVTVQNNSKKDEDVTLSFEAPGLDAKIDGAAIKVAAGSVAGALIEVSASAQGLIPFKIVAQGSSRKDVVQGEVRVEPSGIPVMATTHGWTSAGGVYRTTWEVPAGASGDEAYLSIALPSVTSAMAGVEFFENTTRDAPLSITADLATAALLLQYATRRGIDSPALTNLRERVMVAVGALQFAQNVDGSFNYWRHGKPSVYVTAWALEGLVEAQQLDVAVPQSTIVQSAEWLADQVGSDGLVDVSAIAFWEGDSSAVRLGVSAEIFHVLSRIPAATRNKRIEAGLDRLTKHFVAYLDEPTLDPLAAGRAVQALSALGKLDKGSAGGVIKKLLSARDERHWEPSWFHAYAGRVDTTAAMIQAMVTVDPKGYAAEIRDAVKWVLSTRESWGVWHSERATAAAVRALMAAGVRHEDYSGTITIAVDGKKVRDYTIDGADPFISALELNHLSLGRGLGAGKHEVTVAFDGEPLSVMHVSRVWPKRSLSRKASEGGYTLTAWAPRSKLIVGQESEMKLTVNTPASREVSRVHIAPSGLVAVDMSALARAIESQPAITGARLGEEGIVLSLEAGKAHTITLPVPMIATRPGEGAYPTMLLTQGGEEKLAATGGALTCTL